MCTVKEVKKPGNPILERRSTVLLLLCMSRSGDPPWILKRGGLESSGRRLISLIGKTKRIAFFFFSAKKKNLFKKISIFLKKKFFFNLFLKIYFAEEKNPILLVLPIKEISLQPELSSPLRFRIQGGYPQRYGGLTDALTMDKNH